ncbi:threonine/serine exporter, partial [Enterococcus durans]|nr:threonine/serine exporter [Enterococcus durans]
MNSRDHFPDEELRRRIMDFIMAAGQTLLENGAEVFRVEQTMEIMARS